MRPWENQATPQKKDGDTIYTETHEMTHSLPNTPKLAYRCSARQLEASLGHSYLMLACYYPHTYALLRTRGWMPAHAHIARPYIMRPHARYARPRHARPR